jgi:phage/plasmid-associated DNA primase
MTQENKIVFDLKSSKLNNIEAYELVDRKALKNLMNSSLLKNSFNNVMAAAIYSSEFNQLKAYENNKVDTDFSDEVQQFLKIKVVYDQSIPYGRVNPKKSLGLHSIRREVRHTIGNSYFSDIDIKNCHFFIAEQLAKKIDQNIEIPTITEYNNDPTKFRDEIKNYFKCEKDQAKSLLICILNLGGVNNWATKNNIKTKKDENGNVILPEKLKKLKKECQKIGELVYSCVSQSVRTEIDKKKETESEFDLKVSCVAYTYQQIENEMLEIVFEYCKNNKLIDDVFVLSNDGIMIPKENYDTSLPDKFSKIIFDKLGYNVKFENKAMDQGYTEEQILLNKHFHIDLDNVIEHKECADMVYFYSPNKYVFCEFLGWYEMDKNNTYEHKNIPPSSLYTTIHEILAREFGKIKIIIENGKTEINAIIKKNKKENKEDEDDENKEKLKKKNEQLKKVNDILKKASNDSFCGGVIKFLQNLYKINNFYDMVDKNDKIFAFNNCVYDFTISKYRKIKPTDYISKTTGYDLPMKIINNEIHPIRCEESNKIIKSFFNSLFEPVKIETSDKILCEDADYLFNLLARSLCMSGDQWGVMLYGAGGNGKSLVSLLVKQTIGKYFKMIPSNYMVNVNTNATGADSVKVSLPGHKILMTSEPESSKNIPILNISLYKQITGGDPISARALFSNSITDFTLSSSFFMQTNVLPQLDDVNDALIRRLRVLTFPYSFKEEPTLSHHKLMDKSLGDKLKNPILIKEFAIMLIEKWNEIKGQNIKMSKSVKETTERYFNDNDAIRNFVSTYLIPDKHNKYIKLSELCKYYKEISEKTITLKDFTSKLFTKILDNPDFNELYKNRRSFELIDGKAIIKGVSMRGYKIIWNETNKKAKTNGELIAEEEEEDDDDNTKYFDV